MYITSREQAEELATQIAEAGRRVKYISKVDRFKNGAHWNTFDIVVYSETPGAYPSVITTVEQVNEIAAVPA